MQLIPKLAIGLWNAYLPIVFYLVFTMLFSYFLDKEGFKRGGDESWVKKEDKLLLHLSGYIYMTIIIFSIFVPLNNDTNLFNVGIVIYILTMLLSAYTSYSFVTAPQDKLITKGIYKYSRNPIYLVNSLVIIITGLLTNASIYFILFAIYIISTYFTIKIEEEYCAVKYADDYREYLKHTARYFWKI